MNKEKQVERIASLIQRAYPHPDFHKHHAEMVASYLVSSDIGDKDRFEIEEYLNHEESHRQRHQVRELSIKPKEYKNG